MPSAPPIRDPEVKAAFEAHPPKLRKALRVLRALVFEAAREAPDAGDIVETLKWGQPSYLPVTPKTGSTVRIGTQKGDVDHYAVYFHCGTGLVAAFRELYPDTFRFEGNRAIYFALGDEVPARELKHCIALALTYHARKRAA